jgi:glutaredoxin
MFTPSLTAPAIAGGGLPVLTNRAVATTGPEVVLVTRSAGCPACLTVKTVFNTLGIRYREVDVDKPENGPAVRGYLAAAAPVRSLPLMFSSGRFVAGGLSCIEEARRGGY